MGEHTIPEGAFFTHSPKITVRCRKEDDKFVQDTLDNERGIFMKGTSMNCFQRPSSDEDRKGHHARLSGVKRMDQFLRYMGNKATVRYHGKVRTSGLAISSNTEKTHLGERLGKEYFNVH
jgi:hypothetical protein